jgi:competence ComEA-like helix-hairpin-helix protein
MKKAGIIAVGCTFALSALLAGCTDRNRNDETGLRRDDTSSTRTEQVEQQQPGSLADVEKDKSHADVKVRKDITEKRVDIDKESVPTVARTEHKLDINRADRDDFQAFGLSREMADKIVQYRKDHGDFKSVDDLRSVPGFNLSWFQQYRSKLGVSTG